MDQLVSVPGSGVGLWIIPGLFGAGFGFGFCGVGVGTVYLFVNTASLLKHANLCSQRRDHPQLR